MSANIKESMKNTLKWPFLILWGDEILEYMPPCLGGGDNGINETTELCVIANCLMEVRALPLQQQKAFLNFQGGFFMTIRSNTDDSRPIEYMILNVSHSHEWYKHHIAPSHILS